MEIYMEQMMKIKSSIWLIILDNQLIILRIKYEYPKRISFHPRAKNSEIAYWAQSFRIRYSLRLDH